MNALILTLVVLAQGPQEAKPEWKTYSSDEGFTVSLPGNPVEQKSTLPSPAGPIANLTVIGKSGSTVYLVLKIANPTPIPESGANQFFQGIRGSQTKQGKILAEKEVAHQGHPGREYTLEAQAQAGQTLVMVSRYYLVSADVTFNLQVIYSKAEPAPAPRDVAAFFDSLKLNAGSEKRPNIANAKAMKFQPFEPPGAGFTVLMPSKPNESKSRQTANGISFTIQSFECLTAVGLYNVTIFEYGPEVASATAAVKTQMLTRMAEAFVGNDKGKISRAEDTEWEGFPARRVSYTADVPNLAPLRGEIGAIMSGSKVYFLIAKGTEDKLNPADAGKFFESFHLTSGSATARSKNAAKGIAAADPAARPGPGMTGRTRPAPGNRQTPAAGGARARRPERVAWKRFTSAAGGFHVQMPGEPATTHEDEGLLGAKDVEIFTASTDQASYIVQYQDLPRTALKKGAAAVLKSARVSDERIVKGKVAGEKEATLKGASSGRAYQIEAPGATGIMARVRSYLVGDRLYQVIVVGPRQTFPADDSERFFRSFRLQDRN